MQAHFGAPAIEALAVCGWTPRTPALLHALETHHFHTVAIGDPAAASLAAATTALRGRTFCPARYQHPREMLRRGPGTTVLLDLPDAATEILAAVQRGTALLLTGDAIEAPTLAMIARTGGTAALLRPLWHSAPITAVLDAARALARLRTAAITVEAPSDVRAIADDLLALAARIAGQPVRSITATAYGPPHSETESIVTDVEFIDGSTAFLTARSAGAFYVDIALSSFTTTIDATGDGLGGTLTVTTAGRSVITPLVEDDRDALAVAHALDILATGGIDAGLLFAEAALLRTLDDALEGTVPPPLLATVRGGGHRSEPRRGHLHLVDAGA